MKIDYSVVIDWCLMEISRWRFLSLSLFTKIARINYVCPFK